ncbi:catalase family protein [Enterovirga sp. CN4-39]|uniref:catalase family protein n=1 Tax=Enterovirga sp. CN4-39 TaxID=3400910 RepID=UPI003C00D28E
MSLPLPVRYSPDVETILPDEEDTVRQINETFDTILNTTSRDYGHAVRAVHAKAHGLLKATLTINDGLLPELSQGLFARPGRYETFLRISTNAGDILDDAISLPRGLAMKVVGAEGERLPGATGSTQDFVMVDGPTFQARTAKEFLGALKLVAKTTDVAEGGKRVLSTFLRGVNKALGAIGIESATVKALGGAPNAHPLGETYYSVTPFRYGDYIAKFSLKPIAPEIVALAGVEIDASHDRDALRHRIQADMAGIDAAWEFRVQLCRDLQKQPVEDPTVEWKEEEAPFLRVGTVIAKRQDSWDPALVRAVDEEMRFSVWTGLAAHQPLGNINRARREPYRHSSDFRARFNLCPIHEPA